MSIQLDKKSFILYKDSLNVLLEMTDGEAGEFIKAIYNDNLMNFYELQFNLITKMNISYDHFMSMTFNESRMYVAMQNKDTKKQEEAQKKSQGNLPL